MRFWYQAKEVAIECTFYVNRCAIDIGIHLQLEAVSCFYT